MASDVTKLTALANGAESTVQTTESESENGTTKRKYNRTPKLEFNSMELYALTAILNGDKNVNGAWNSHLLAKIAPFLPTAPDLSQPPTMAETTQSTEFAS